MKEFGNFGREITRADLLKSSKAALAESLYSEVENRHGMASAFADVQDAVFNVMKGDAAPATLGPLLLAIYPYVPKDRQKPAGTLKQVASGQFLPSEASA